MRDWRDIIAWSALVLVAVAALAFFAFAALLVPADYL